MDWNTIKIMPTTHLSTCLILRNFIPFTADLMKKNVFILQTITSLYKITVQNWPFSRSGVVHGCSARLPVIIQLKPSATRKQSCKAAQSPLYEPFASFSINNQAGCIAASDSGKFKLYHCSEMGCISNSPCFKNARKWIWPTIHAVKKQHIHKQLTAKRLQMGNI